MESLQASLSIDNIHLARIIIILYSQNVVLCATNGAFIASYSSCGLPTPILLATSLTKTLSCVSN